VSYTKHQGVCSLFRRHLVMSCNDNMTTNDRNPCMLLISVIFQPCTFVRHFPVLHFPALHFCPIYSSPAFSTPTPPIFHCPSFYCLAFSAPPISADSLYCCVTANAHAVTVTTVTCIYSAPPTIRPMAHSRLQSSQCSRCKQHETGNSSACS